MKFLKFLLVAGGIMVVLAVVLSNLSSQAPSASIATGGATSSQETDLTMAKYTAIKMGMTYRQLFAILDSPGEELSGSDIPGTTTVMYAWRKWTGANMNAMFQNDKLVSKAQFGLQ